MPREIDHLDGHLYVEKVEGQLHDVTYEGRNRRRGKKQKKKPKRGEDHESYICGNPGFAVGTLEEICKKQDMK